MKPLFDDQDAVKLAARIEKWNKRDGIRVGDWCLMRDGTERRFTHDWGDDTIQTTSRHAPGDSSFYCDPSGYLNYSGSLDPAVPKTSFTDTGEVKAGSVWFFHHDHMKAHNGVHADIPCRVYKEN